MARPIIHVKFADIILTMLRCTCRDCGRILIPKNKIDSFKEILEVIEVEQGVEARRDKIKELIATLKSVNACPYCKAKQQKVTLEKPTTYLENEKRLSPIEI